MGFLLEDFTAQPLYIALITEIKNYRLALKKVNNIIMNFVLLKYQAALKGNLAKEIEESLKAKSQHISPISIPSLLLKTIKIQLLEYSDIYKY